MYLKNVPPSLKTKPCSSYIDYMSLSVVITPKNEQKGHPSFQLSLQIPKKLYHFFYYRRKTTSLPFYIFFATITCLISSLGTSSLLSSLRLSSREFSKIQPSKNRFCSWQLIEVVEKMPRDKLKRICRFEFGEKQNSIHFHMNNWMILKEVGSGDWGNNHRSKTSIGPINNCTDINVAPWIPQKF